MYRLATESEPRTEFDAVTQRLLRRRLIAACALALSITPLYAVSDYLLHPEQFVLLAAAKAVSIVVTGALLVFAYGPLGLEYAHWVGILLATEVAFASSGIAVLLFGYTTPESAGFALVILGVALLMPWRMVHAACTSGILLGMYVACALTHGAIRDQVQFWTNVSFLVTACIVAVISTRATAELQRRELRARAALQDVARQKTDLATSLELKSAQLSLINQEMEDLLYVASHDLRAPLINVQGFTRELQIALDALRRELPPTPEARALVTDLDESTRFILTAVARMDGLIGSLLNLSRIATRTNPTDVVPLGAMVDAIVDSFRYQIDQKQITIAIGDLPVVIGDPVRLNQAVSNLVDNAIKYMGDRPLRRIEIGARIDDGTATCFVRDSGPGIPKAKHETVFRLFHRLPNGAVPGEGIGLTMVRKIIEKHGGRVWLEAEPDEGTTFFFTLRTPKPASLQERTAT